ncbi:hypothetical protein [Streptomyces sp. CT34]|uniref:hypothetical protein n=1 Tax=Streptomyces sp. CT34 TaxID=1553907 RepID=UPI0005B98A1D|nr:hypothetical protein [Streptomyces sp. CT34]
MRKLQKAAVMAAALGSFGFLGAGIAYAASGSGGTDFNVKQANSCRSNDADVDALDDAGIANGLAGNALDGEGTAGAQSARVGSSMSCVNSVAFKGSKGGDEGKGEGSEGRESNGNKGGDARKGGGSEGREGREGNGGKEDGGSTQGGASPAHTEGGAQRGTTPGPGLRYTVRTETLSTS